MRPMSPNQRTRIRVQLNDAGYAFPRGHGLRLAVSTQYWPMVWPSPDPVVLTVFGGRLDLPRRPPRPEDERLRDLGEPAWGPEAPVTVLRPGRWARDIAIDALTATASVTNVVEAPLNRLDRIGRAIAVSGFDRSTLRDGDPTSATAVSRRAYEIVRDGTTIRVSADVTLSCARDEFGLDVAMEAHEDERLVWNREWHTAIARDGV
jgi:hypothetical protein